MNELIESLVKCLKEETSHYRRLAELAIEQKELLIAGKVELLSENVRLEEKEVFALGPLASSRKEILAKMAKAYRLVSIDLNEALKRAPMECIEDFKASVLELVQAAKRLEAANQGNEKLLNNALSYVNFSLKLIANGGRKKTFSPSATMDEKGPSLVDRTI